MISAMPSSEMFPVSSQPKCTSSPYHGILVSPAVSSLLHGSAGDPTWLSLVARPDYQCLVKMAPLEQSVICNAVSVCGGGLVQSGRVSPSRTDDGDLSDLPDVLDQLDLDEALYDPSKPLKIDPQVLKIDFSRFSNHDRTLDELPVATEAGGIRRRSDVGPVVTSQSNRSSRHLSGGGILSDCNCQAFQSSTKDCPSADSDVTSSSSEFHSQISPSSPLTFDLSIHPESTTDSRISDLSTNPFKTFMNPFDEKRYPCSVEQVETIECQRAGYENVPLPTKKSFSQCSTRAVSPNPDLPLSVHIPTDSSQPSTPCQFSPSSNPFLLNTSPTPTDTNPFKFLLNERPSQLPASSSFILAVPVFSIFQNVAQSSCSTQTSEPELLPSRGKQIAKQAEQLDQVQQVEHVEPVYQNNPPAHLRKFMMRHDHSDYDLQCLKRTVHDLRVSGWYYENVSWQDSVVLLKDTEPGTFLVRDSSDPNFLFSLSVQTSRGPTSVRLHYINGHFRLDAERKLIPHMPSFGSIIELVDYYIKNTKRRRSARKAKKSKEQVWIDSAGNIYSNILLVRPLRRRERFPPLQHLTRLVINNTLANHFVAKEKMCFKVTPVYESSPFQDAGIFLDGSDVPPEFNSILSIEKLPLPQSLVQFLKQYPYCH